jgi:DNA-binding response OmpR family regulator
MLVKPFSLPELILRVKKQTGQAHDRPDHRILYAKGIELDLTARQVKVRDESVSLTATEFRLLECLMINQTRALSMEQLL